MTLCSSVRIPPGPIEGMESGSGTQLQPYPCFPCARTLPSPEIPGRCVLIHSRLATEVQKHLPVSSEHNHLSEWFSGEESGCGAYRFLPQKTQRVVVIDSQSRECLILLQVVTVLQSREAWNNDTVSMSGG